MAYRIRRVEHYHANVRNELESAYRVLQPIAGLGVNLLAFAAVPSGPDVAQRNIFPEDPGKLRAEARAAHLQLDGPYHALARRSANNISGKLPVRSRSYLRRERCHGNAGGPTTTP